MKTKGMPTIMLAVCVLLGGCGGRSDTPGTDEQTTLAPVRPLMALDAYDLDTYLLPIWDAREIYQETVMFFEGESERSLLYAPQDIICVRNYGLDIVYEEGKDYTLSEDGKLVLPEGSSIPRFAVEEYYLTQPDTRTDGKDATIKVYNDRTAVPLEGDHWLNFFERDELTSKQISVCYRHAQPWKGPVPEGKGEKLQNFLSKVGKGKSVTILFYGDSITTGAQSSSYEHMRPQADIWPEMIKKYIEKEYGVTVNYLNEAVGGYTTARGAENFSAGVNRSGVDLLVLGFGMNDPETSPMRYTELMMSMIEAFRQTNPSGEVIAVAPMTPNYETDWYGNQASFRNSLSVIEGRYGFCACADVTSMFEYLFTAGKQFRDVTVNNVNHPNDFAARLYAQVILKTIFGDEFRKD